MILEEEKNRSQSNVYQKGSWPGHDKQAGAMDLYIGTDPRYPVLKRQGYKILILSKDLVFYKIDEANRRVVIYAVVDQRQDYLSIIMI